MKYRVHNEWFRAVERGGRKTCSYCEAKFEAGEWIWAWIYYHNAKARLIRDFCKSCWHEVAEVLQEHTTGCQDHCKLDIRCRGASRPEWMKLPEGVEV